MMNNGYYHTLYFEATRKCNYACPYCSSGSNGSMGIEEDMDCSTIVSRIFIPAKKLGTRFIAFSGGEFLLRDDALYLLKTASELGFGIAIASNGATLTDTKLNELKKILGNNLLISLGINSLDDINAETRCQEISKTYDTIILLEKHNIRCNIAVTMGSFNASVFSQTLDKIRELALPFNRIPFVPRNVPCSELMFNKKIMKEILHPALNKTFHGYVSFTPFFLSEKDYYRISESNKEMSIPLNPSVGCWCGSFYSITPAGEVAPCPLLGDRISGGNILHENLEDILFQSPLFQRIIQRDTFGGKCGKCRFRFTCGGCRAMAYYQTGDMFQEDPTCFIDKLSEEEIVELERNTARNFRYYCKMANLGDIVKPEKM